MFLSPCLCRETFSEVRRVTRLPEQPWVSQIFLNLLTNLEKIGWVEGVTHLAGSPYFDGRVILQAELSFLHILWVAYPSQLGKGERIRVCTTAVVSSWHGQKGQLYITIALHINGA